MKVTDELERIWNVAQFEVLSRYLHGGSDENCKKRPQSKYQVTGTEI